MMKKVGIVACSDAQKEEYREQNEELIRFFESIGIESVMSSCIYENAGSIFSGSSKESSSTDGITMPYPVEFTCIRAASIFSL